MITSPAFVELVHTWLAALYRASWQGAIAVGLVWCLCRLIPRLPASIRCWLWRAVLVKMLLVIVWPGTIDLAWLPVGERLSANAAVPGEAVRAPSARLVEFPAGSQFGSPAAVNGTRHVTPYVMLWWAWASGVLAVIGILVFRVRSARRLRKQCTVIKDVGILTLCETLSNDLGVYQPPVLFVSDVFKSPVVFGAMRTSVVLPAHLLSHCDMGRMALILRHELAHIQRNDLLWNWVATAVWGLLFFHPLVWLALRELRLSQELACDAVAVASHDTLPAEYGKLLVELGDRARLPSNLLATVGVVESFEFLKRRLKALGDVHDRSAWASSVSIAVLSLAVAGLLPWRLVAQSPKIDMAAGAAATPAIPDSLVSPPPNKRLPARPVSATPFKIAVANVRRVDEKTGRGWQMIFDPLNLLSDRFTSPDRLNPPASSRSWQPNCIVDLQVARSGDFTDQILCTLLGAVTAEDDRGNPALPCFGGVGTRLEIRGVDYPQGTGCVPVHLAVTDKNATALKSLSGELLIVEASVHTTAFEGEELEKVSIHQVEGVPIRLDEVHSTDHAVYVTTRIAPDVHPDVYHISGVIRLRVQVEDSGGRLYEPLLRSGPSSRAGESMLLMNCQFGALPKGVMVKRVICTLTEFLGAPQSVAFEVKDILLP